MCSIIYNYPKIQGLTRKYNEKLQKAMRDMCPYFV